MNLAGGIVVFIIIWWVIFFMTLSWGIKPNKGDVDGVPAGAPEEANIKKKMIVTTIISILLWGLFYTLIKTGVLTYEIFV